MSFDVAVIGAGPAGAVAAAGLARSGLSVALIEATEFPRDKVCGGCLHPRALLSLRRIGLGDLPDRLGAGRFDQLNLALPGRTTRIPLASGRAVSRRALDAALAAEARRAGSQWHHATVLDVHLVRDRRVLRLRRPDGSEDELEASLVVAATGLAGRIGDVPTRVHPRTRIGAGVVLPPGDPLLPRGEVLMMVTSEGYVGCVQAEEDLLVCAAALDPTRIAARGGITELISAIVAAAGPPGLDLTGPWRGTPRLTHRPTEVGAERLLLLGDAAGYIEPFTGEGMAWALASAEAIVPVATAAVASWTGDHVRRWRSTLDATVGSRWACRAISTLVRHPRLLGPLLRLGGGVPAMVAKSAWSPA